MPYPQFQYGLALLILILLAGGLISAALWVWPANIGMVTLLVMSLVISPVLIVEIVWGNSEYWKAFCIGALVSTSVAAIAAACGAGFVTLLFLINGGNGYDEFLRSICYCTVALWGVSIICGLICCVRLWVIKRSRTGT